MYSINWQGEVGFCNVKERWILLCCCYRFLSLGSGKVETLADLHRSYNYLANESVAYKPFHNQQSKPTFADFMRHAA